MELAERKALRAQITRQVNTAKDLLAEDLNIEELSAVLSCLKLTNEKLNAVSKKVVSGVEEENLEDEFEKMLEYEEKAVATIARLEHRISAADPFSDRGSSAHQLIRATSAEVDVNDPGENLPEARQPEAEHQTGNNNNINRNTVRLPKLELKKFDGYLNNWAPFWEQFKSVIHENNDLDQRAKFNYLQTVLTGKAAAAISGLVPSENCYADAIDMLKNEFGNSEKIIDHYIKSLMSIAPVKNKNDVVALRKLYNSVTSITRSLNSLGISANRYGLMVKSVIMKTLPYVMRIDYNKLSSSEEFSDINSVVSVADSYEKQIDKLLNFIKIEVESIEQAQGVLSSDNPYHKNKYSELNATKIKGKPSSEFCTAAGLFTAAKNTCLFCNRDSHLTVDCNKPTTLTERKDILKTNNRCFRCLKPNHSSRFCRTDKLKCEKCSARHVTIMCDPEYIKNIKSNALQKENVKSTSLFANNEINNVYLQTACAFVYSNDNSQAYIRLIIDGGSQLTFIRECLSRKLNLPIVGTRNISVYSFGNSKHPPSSMCKQVLLKLRNRQNSTTIEIRAIEVPEICFDILSPPTVNHPAIEGLQLADAVTNEGLQPLEGINLLIGADNYWQIVTGEYLKLSSDLVAVNTKLGWAIHGQSEEVSCSANLVTALHVQATMQTTNEDDCLESNIKRF